MRRFINSFILLTLVGSDALLRAAATLVLLIWGAPKVNVAFFALAFAGSLASNWGPRGAARYVLWRIKRAKARVETDMLEGRVMF